MARFRLALTVVVLLCAVPLFAQTITDVTPGAYDDVNTCDEAGVWTATGNPGPGILLQKFCSTPTYAYAYADIISPLENGSTPASAVTSFAFDVNNAGHCGAGAPRFEIVAGGSYVITLGCAAATRTDLGNGWTRVSFDTAQIQAAVLAAGATPASIINDMFVLFDEGSDTPTVAYNTTSGTPSIGTPGQVIIDNLQLNGGAVVGTSPAIPTVSQLALAAMALALAVAGAFALKL